MNLYLQCLSFLAFSSFVHGLIQEENQCQLANWYDSRNNLPKFNQLIIDLSNSGVIKNIGDLDPNQSFSGSFKKSFLGYDYKLDVKVVKLKISGVNGLYIKPIDVLDETVLKLQGGVNGDLHADVTFDFTINQLTNTGCKDDEEEYLGLCYKKCSILTRGSHPLRTATNTCSKNGCDHDQEESMGFCYPKCSSTYEGTGPVCWAKCNEHFGPKYKNVGFTCIRTWYPSVKMRPSYKRGLGRLKYAPWTKGLGCNGFGINSSGGCATPYYRLCMTEKLKIKSSKCKPKHYRIHAKLGLNSPSLSAVTDLKVMMCNGKLKKNSVACRNIVPADFLKAAFSGSFGKLWKKALQRVQSMSIKKIQYSWEHVSEAEVRIINGKRKITNKFLGFVLSFSKSLLNSKGRVYKFVVNKLEEWSTNVGNELIQKKFAPSFGSTCSDA